MRRRAAALASSRRSWAESTAWSRLTADIALLSPTSADCTATCSISSGSPPVARSRRRTSCACSARSTCCPPAARMRRRNSSTAGPSRGARWAGTGSGPTRTTDSAGWPAVVSAVTTTRASLVASSTDWRTGPASVVSRSRPSRTSRHSRPSTARPRAPVSESPGAVSDSRLSRAATSTSSIVRRLRASTHEAAAGRGCGDVAHEQRLAAAGRAHDGDPPRLLQRLVQRSLHVLTTETGGQHDTNLSLLRT